MNNRQNGRRRGRGGQQARNGQPSNPHSNSRLDNRQRGNAVQLLEKYKTLARDAQMQGDRVNTEYYLQFADHYFRVLSESRSRLEEQRPQRRDEFGQDFGTEDDGEQQPRTYGTRDFADDGWDDGEEDGDARPQPQPQREQPQREPQGQREPHYRREAQPREPQDPREPQGQREQPAAREPVQREPREPRPAPARGERRPLRLNGNGTSPPSGDTGIGGGNGGAPIGAEAAPEAAPRIDYDRLPPALSATPASELPLEAAEDMAPPKRRRTRKPKTTDTGMDTSTDSAAAEA